MAARRRRDVATASPRWKACASPTRTACCGRRPAITKLELARYYVEIADWILPHVAGRPLALVRAPRGHTGTTFFQKHVARGMPEAIRGVTITGDDGPGEHVWIDSVAGLVGLVQMDVLELHAWGSRVDQVERPDRLVLDLDPDEGLAWARVVEAARAARLLVEHLGLDCGVKTTGGKGLHVVIPIARRLEWPAAKAFAHGLAADLARRLPDAFTVNQSKAARRGKIYLDYLRNGRGATAIAAYSTRARPGATVSTPVAWDELEAGITAGAFTLRTVPERLSALPDDPWSDLDGIAAVDHRGDAPRGRGPGPVASASVRRTSCKASRDALASRLHA